MKEFTESHIDHILLLKYGKIVEDNRHVSW